MVISSGSASFGAIGEIAVRNAIGWAFDRLQPIPAGLNKTATTDAGRVHLCEFAVIFDNDASPDRSHSGLSRHAGSLAVARWRRYKRRNSPKAFEGRNHGD
jgi:hypothetical protein